MPDTNLYYIVAAYALTWVVLTGYTLRLRSLRRQALAAARTGEGRTQ